MYYHHELPDILAELTLPRQLFCRHQKLPRSDNFFTHSLLSRNQNPFEESMPIQEELRRKVNALLDLKIIEEKCHCLKL